MKNKLKKLMTIGLIAVSSPLLAQEYSPIVQVEQGQIRGLASDTMNSYMGIPYAKPPVGELRWRPPQSAEAWQGIKDTVAYGSSCPQNADLGIFAKAGGQEDCLTLNVFTPTDIKANEKRPVLVWIHGGSLFVGQGADYDPSLLVAQGSIVVTINYRLALLGFFAHPALSQDGQADINYGLMDQNLALDWVQKNIAQFGGDPNNVTISGESSGGGNVLAHVLSPWSKGKFQQAIAMSGSSMIIKYPFFAGSRTRAEAEQQGIGFAEKVCAKEQDVAHCLRNLPLETILANQTPYIMNKPVVDGNFIPMNPNEAFKTGKFNKVTLINGTTHDEGTFFAGFVENLSHKPYDNQGYLAALEKMHGKEFAKKVYQHFPPENYITPSDAFAASMTSFLFTCPAQRLTTLAAQYTPTYAYQFSDQTAPSYLAPTSFPLKAAHTFELPYIFPGFKGSADNPIVPQLNDMQTHLAQEMAAIWADPKTALANRKDWQPYNPDKNNRLEFVLPKAVIKTGYNETLSQCDFWLESGVYN